METTVQLDERLLAEAKRYAERSHRSLSQIVEEALRDKLKTALTSKQPALAEADPDVHPEVRRISGLVPTEIDAEAFFRAHTMARHQ